MWRYSNPVAITFGVDAFGELPEADRAASRYALVTYPDAPFAALAAQLRQLAGDPVVTVNDVAPNPDTRLLAEQSTRFGAAGEPKIIVALGGGSVIDTAKVLAAARGGFQPVRRYLQTGTGAEALSATPIIAVPTTAGTGSEVTPWATIWDPRRARSTRCHARTSRGGDRRSRPDARTPRRSRSAAASTRSRTRSRPSGT